MYVRVVVAITCCQRLHELEMKWCDLAIPGGWTCRSHPSSVSLWQRHSSCTLQEGLSQPKLQDNYRSPDCRGWILSCSRSYFASAVAVEDLEWRWFWCLHSRRFRYVSIFGRVVLATSSCWQPVLDRGMNNDQHPKAQNSIKPVMLCIGIANSHVLFWEPADALPSGILIP